MEIQLKLKVLLIQVTLYVWYASVRENSTISLLLNMKINVNDFSLLYEFQ